MSTEATRETIRQFVTSNFLLGGQTRNLSDDDSFLDNGIIDSTGILELVSFVEQTFNVRCEDDELIPENLDSVSRLTAFVERKMTGTGSNRTFAIAGSVVGSQGVAAR